MQNRIEDILASSSLSDRARQYLVAAIKCGRAPDELFEKSMTNFVEKQVQDTTFGINVVRKSNGQRMVVFGHIDFLHYGEGQTNCDFDTILTIMESGECVPDWWDDQCTAVYCAENNGSGYRTQADIDNTSGASD